ncbi:hypothetical protein SAMN05216548_11461 [Faunimonas pinastri]|uniref:Uncharacterized protein n=1 Tax=Faunimonas pinastri TaxID=1855383 RepID=A0A1H9MVI8_9HYPH|nr:hypothetical protein [Faunimonas pinastri]SER27489.1 hypothetical protein SAMN05216548_11461 [Faunimonas pinastri]
MSVEFARRKEELAQRLIEAARQYMMEAGQPEFSRSGLSQMSMDLQEVAGEMLCFGGDIWPVEVAREALMEESPIAPKLILVAA